MVPHGDVLRRCGVSADFQPHARRTPGPRKSDDFNGVDIDELADGAFEGMAGFFDLLGLQTKPSKAQNTSAKG